MKIWWYKDDKTGHLKQVEAVLDELKKDFALSIKEINCKKSPFKDILNLLAAIFFKDTNSNPDILIGAGHNTYLKILADKIRLGASKTKSIAILKPSIFRSWFDLICAPEHDYYENIEKNTYTFIGSLAKVIDNIPDKDIGLIAVGGKNQHYEFSTKEIFKQIEFILNLYQKKTWYIFNSRRTPPELTQRLNSLNSDSINFIDIENQTTDLNEIVGKADIKFVSPDSVNLVFESLSSKGSTYLFYLKPKNNGFKMLRNKKPDKNLPISDGWKFYKNKIIELMNKLKISRDVGYVEFDDIAKSIKAYSLKKPNSHYQLYAEVEKVAYQISKLIRS